MANGHTSTSVHYRERSATCEREHSNGRFFSVASVAGERKGVTKCGGLQVELGPFAPCGRAPQCGTKGTEGYRRARWPRL